jgi:hypothetical protein
MSILPRAITRAAEYHLEAPAVEHLWFLPLWQLFPTVERIAI